MPCVRSLPGVDATTVSVLEAAGMPTIEHVLACAPSELRADPRVEQVRLPPLTAHQRYCVRRDAPTRIVTLPSLPLPHLCHPWSSCRAKGFAAQRASARQHCRLTEQDSAHKTAADLTALGGRLWRGVRCWGGAAAGGEGRAGLRVAA